MITTFQNNEVEELGFLFWPSKEEKLLKVLKPTFREITLNTVKNLFKLYTASAKKFGYTPSDTNKKTSFVNDMSKNSGISTNLIAVFIDRLNDSVANGNVDIKAINPTLNKSTWQYYVYPVLGIAALIAVARISTNVRGLAAIYKK